MNKITIPICGDTLFIGIITGLFLVMIGLLAGLQYMIITDFNTILGWMLFSALLLFQYSIVLSTLVINNKDEWADKMIPFKTKECET